MKKRKTNRNRRKKQNKKAFFFKKNIFYLFSLMLLIAVSICAAKYFKISKIFANSSVFKTIQSDDDFSNGSLTDTEVLGSGNDAIIQLEGNGGVGWFNPDWKRRKAVTITNSEGVLSNYQIKLTIDYDSDMQSDFDDLRFANSGGDNLNYWIESKTDGDSAIVGVKVDSIEGNGDTTIYEYYGNEEANSASSGNDTFEFFDDFDDGII